MAAIFIHHRDLRQIDNIGLNAACAKYKVYPIFIYTVEQIVKNPYKNKRSIKFMSDALLDLTVTVFRAKRPYEEALRDVLTSLPIVVSAIFENRDFSPFARRRQKITKKVALELKKEYVLCEDHCLLPMGTFLKKDGSAYVKFTPFHQNALRFKVPEPVGSKPHVFLLKSEHAPAKRAGYRLRALKILERIDDWKTYFSTRDFPQYETTRLAAHLQFGTISIREAYHAIKNATLKKQLYWRDFYMYITEYINTDYSKEPATKKLSIKWKHDPVRFKAWCSGKTGVPIVDAGMAELNQTGYMHNRCRMIVAMFLIFHLHIHWKEGEKYFSQNLEDYSYSNNFGGWVWCSGTEVYSNDYYRAFSMEQQSKRFDPQAVYIKKWLPQLKDIPPAALHKSGLGNSIIKDLKAARIEGIELIRGRH